MMDDKTYRPSFPSRIALQICVGLGAIHLKRAEVAPVKQVDLGGQASESYENENVVHSLFYSVAQSSTFNLPIQIGRASCRERV